MKMTEKFLSFLCLCGVLSGAVPSPRQDQQQPVARVAVNEVLLDVVVTDKKGKQVKGVRPEEFEVLEDGVPQKLTSVHETAVGAPEIEGTAKKTPAPPRITVAGGGPAISPEYLGLSLVVMAFDRISPGNRKFAGDAALQYLKELAPNEYVSVMAIDRALRIISPFTNNRERLSQAVLLASGGTPQQFSDASKSIRETLQKARLAAEAARSAAAAVGPGSGSNPNMGASFAEAAFNQALASMLRHSSLAEMSIQGWASIESMLQIVRGVSEFPGRKSVLYFAERVLYPAQLKDRYLDMVSAANRANVSFYCIDATGLDPARELEQMQAELAHLSDVSRGQATKRAGEAVTRDEVMLSENAENAIQSSPQNSLAALAGNTGGVLVANTNDLQRGLRSVSEDIRSHYELVYTPANQNYDGSFRKLQVKVKHSGMVVRSREGYYAFRKDDPAENPRELTMLAALNSERLPADIQFRAMSMHFPAGTNVSEAVIFAEVPLAGFMLKVDPQKSEYNGTLDTLVMIRDSAGKIVEKYSQDFPLQGPVQQLEDAKRKSFLFYRTADLAPGRYTVEVVARDSIGGKAGAKRSLLVVPARQEGQPALSSIVLVKWLDESQPESEVLETPLMYNGRLIIPNLRAEVSSGERQAIALYFATAAANEQEPMVELVIAKDGNLLGRTGDQKLPPSDSQGVIRYLASLPISSFSPGNYDLEVIVKQGQSTVRGRTTFLVQ